MKIYSINNYPKINNQYKKSTSNPVSSSKTGFSTISFQGNKNKKQAAFITMEASPILKQGGVGDVLGELPKELNKQDMDTRVFLPIYNAKDSFRRINGTKFVYTNDKNQSFNLRDTGVQAEVEYGLKKDLVRLFKVEDEKVNMPIYMVYCKNSISSQKEQYKGELSEQSANDSAFCKACLELIGKMDGTHEKFNPKFLVTNDWATSFLYPDGVNDFEYSDDYKTVHIVHNAGADYQGKIPPSVAAANVFDKKRTEVAFHDKELKKSITNISEGIDEAITKLQSINLSSEVEKGNYEGAFVKIADNYEFLKGLFYKDLDNADKTIMKRTRSNHYVDGQFNPTKNAVEDANFVVTVSKEYLKDVQKPGEAAAGIDADFRRAGWKSFGIINGLDIKNYNPANQNPNPNKKINYLYNAQTLKKGKEENKLYLQHSLSRSNEGTNSNYKVKQKGYLSYDKDAFVGMLISRYSPEQKGIDILVDAADTFLKENPHAQLILGGPDFDTNRPVVREFEKITSKYRGRAVLLNGFVENMNQFFAGSDAVIMPNRFAPCEILQMQAMRYGCVPIASNLGGFKDIITDTRDDKIHATGFKTEVPLNTSQMPDNELLKTLSRAYGVFTDSKDEWNRIARNAMGYKREYSDVAAEYKKNIFENPLADTDIERFYSIDDKVYRGSQPGKCRGDRYTFETNYSSLKKDIKFLKSQGFDTIIDFRKAAFESDYPQVEKNVAEENGMKHVHIPLDGGVCPTREEIKTFFDAINNSKGKVMFHCRAGVDRTGIMASVYLTAKKGLSPEEAMVQSFDNLGLPRFNYMSDEEREKMIQLLDDVRYTETKYEYPTQPKINENSSEDEKMVNDLSRLNKLLEMLSQ